MLRHDHLCSARLALRPPRRRLLRLATVALTLVAAAAPASAERSDERGSTHRYERPGHDRELFLELFGSDRDAFETHVRTLANPFFEGRAPGTVGGDLAADYLAFYFERLGLEPAFETTIETPGGAAARTVTSYLQPFELGRGRVKADSQQLSIFTEQSHAPLMHGEDFVALGMSGNGDAVGPVTFVGYSIADGREDYTSYPGEVDLTDRIALMLRFEPMTEAGQSLWATEENRWSRHAGLNNKIEAAIERGAAGILLVSPPHADDPRAGALQLPNDTRFGRPYDVPILMITPEVANRILEAGEPQGRDVKTLAEAVAREGEVIDLENVEVNIAASLHLEALTASNVAAVLPGKGDLADEYVVIGGHYDHIGYGRFGARGGNRGVIHIGADDNASGVAGTLLLADRLTDHYESLSDDHSMRSIVFALFTAEEMGLHGSAHFVEEPPIHMDKTVAMLNMDMIGAMQNDTLTVYGTGSADEFSELLEPLFEASGLTVEAKKTSSGRSDEASFQRRAVPGLHFFSGLHDRYHTPRDRPDLLNYDGAIKIVNLVEDVALELAARTEPLTYHERSATQSSARRSEIKVRFGIAPGGYGAEEGGVSVGQVFPGTTAAQAGLEKGDLIIRWGGEDVPDVGRWMELLKEHEPGDAVDIVILRDGEESEIGVVLQGRD
jgi:hypothetical protein